MKQLLFATLALGLPLATHADTIAQPRYDYVFSAPIQVINNDGSGLMAYDAYAWQFQIAIDGYLRPDSCSAATIDNCALQNAGDDPTSHHSTYWYDQKQSPFNGDELSAFKIITDSTDPNLYGPQLTFDSAWGAIVYTFEGTTDFWSAGYNNFGTTPPSDSVSPQSYAYYDDPMTCESCSVQVSVDGVPLTPASSVPEPKSSGLMLLGMGGMCCAAGLYRRPKAKCE